MTRSGRARRRAAPVATGILALLSLAGCGDWPHFDYAEGPPLHVTEVESDAEEQVQNLDRLHSDVQISGVIDVSAYIISEQAPFDLPGWYYGDIDYFQFTVRDPVDAYLLLTWTQQDSILDLYFFTASSTTGELSLVEYRELSGAPVEIHSDQLSPEILYVLAIAGREGESVSYTLSLTFS